MSDEYFQKFTKSLNESSHLYDNLKIKYGELSDEILDQHIHDFFGVGFNIIRVTDKNPVVSEFYPSELNLSWCINFLIYASTFGKTNSNLYDRVFTLSIILLNVKGVNVIDNTVYILMTNYDFIEFRPTKKLFIK